ncbi:hypothetical protein JK364_24190 [Streptomyces sp. 110]|uniref:Uncharacterized protein n=1 Tax=Streptomyces endocoffeicus TaxID=2898945 RepID=A0ABS1PSR3_9ACTN|nr:hypothetical protein [Streptomyces endocoffeicus]MBL1115474.1 hypothetical protein [Streptomyces endocoffeicus]
MSTAAVRKLNPAATIEKILTFDGRPEAVLVRPIPAACRTNMATDIVDRDGCGGTGWICPTCHEGDDCPTVESDECEPGTSGAQPCVCVDGQTGNWEPSSWA